MKSKRNSKQQKKSHKKSSLLLHLPTPTPKLPTNLSLTQLNLPNMKISSLTGINEYKNLTSLNIQNNNIADYETLRPLKNCKKLSVLNIRNNPICERVNYVYGIYLELDKVLEIDGWKVGAEWGVVRGWQRENGGKICGFLLQCCAVIDAAIKKDRKTNVYMITKELSQVKSAFSIVNSVDNNELITSINQNIQRHLPLPSLDPPHPTQSQAQDLNDYFTQKLLQSNPQNKFLQKILNSLEVVDQEQQKQLSIKVQVTKLIMKDTINREYQLQLGNTGGRQQDQGNVKHFTSAETALETVDTVARNRGVQMGGVHFCLDREYLIAAASVIVSQIARLEHILQQTHKQPNKQPHNKTTLLKIRPQPHNLPTYQDQTLAQPLTSPTRIYNNPTILHNITKFLQLSIKRIIFRKIKQSKSQPYLSNILTLVQSSLENALLDLVQFGFKSVKQDYQKQKYVIEGCNRMRLGKMIKAWRNVKKRKIKLLKAIVKRKIKGDNFMLAVIITKWKINSRADRIKRMASAALLGTRISSMPKSKKGIDLAYQRTIQNRKQPIR